MRLNLDGVSVELDRHRIVDEVDLKVGDREVVGLIGPNGSGKSTLLRTVYRALAPMAGVVRLGGDDVWSLAPRESARRTAVVAQEAPPEFDFTVEEVVTLGRLPHKGLFDGETDEDRRLIVEALDRVGIAHLTHRVFTTLSGGEKQKALLAKALVQQPSLLVLDEPTNHLDIRAQLELLELIRELGVSTLTALHELNLAAAYCDRLYLLDGGRLVTSGPPTDVLTPEVLGAVFGVAAHRAEHPDTGRLQLVFAPLRQPITERTSS